MTSNIRSQKAISFLLHFKALKWIAKLLQIKSLTHHKIYSIFMDRFRCWLLWGIAFAVNVMALWHIQSSTEVCASFQLCHRTLMNFLGDLSAPLRQRHKSPIVDTTHINSQSCTQANDAKTDTYIYLYRLQFPDIKNGKLSTTLMKEKPSVTIAATHLKRFSHHFANL